MDNGAERFVLDSKSDSLDYLRKHVEIEKDSRKDPWCQNMHTHGC